MPCKRKGSNWRSTAASSCRARVMLTTTDTTKSLSSKIVMFKLSAASALHNLKPAFKLPGPVRPGLTAPLAIEASRAARAVPATQATRNSLSNSPCPLGRSRGRCRYINNKPFQCSDGCDSCSNFTQPGGRPGLPVGSARAPAPDPHHGNSKPPRVTLGLGSAHREGSGWLPTAVPRR